MKKIRIPPGLVLFLLAPILGEMLSSSSPPREFFQPLTFVTLCILYGGGAVLARELLVKWRKSWPSLLALGAAYGIIEEGLMVKSFFDPGWGDLGLLSTYGRWGGVNWVWTFELILFHMVVSIALPILITSLLYPDEREKSWVGRKTTNLLVILFWFDVAFGYFFLTPYKPSLILYLIAALAVVGLISLAKILPNPEPRSFLKFSRSNWGAYYVGLLLMIMLFFISWVIPSMIPWAIVPILMFFVLLAGGIAWVWRLTGGAWQPERLFALASGGLTFFILISFLLELDPGRAVEMSGMRIVGSLTCLGLIGMLFDLKKRGHLDKAGYKQRL